MADKMWYCPDPECGNCAFEPGICCCGKTMEQDEDEQHIPDGYYVVTDADGERLVKKPTPTDPAAEERAYLLSRGWRESTLSNSPDWWIDPQGRAYVYYARAEAVQRQRERDAEGRKTQ